MRAFDPDPALRWLFCMTHPDDEISIAAWIHRLTTQGNTVHMSWSHSTRVREAEAKAAASLLGVPEGNLHFFGAQDAHVVNHLAELLPAYKETITATQPDRVVCGAFEQGHIDHDSTNWLVNHAFDGPVLEVPFYHCYLRSYQRMNRFADPTGEEILALKPEEQRFKKRIARLYPSQRIWSNLFWYEVYQGVKLQSRDLAKTERMRFQTHRDWLTPNLPEPLASKVRRCDRWKRWVEAIKNLPS